MAVNIYTLPYYTCLAPDVPGEACRLLTRLAREEVNLLAFNAVPAGPGRTQLIIYPLNAVWLGDVVRQEKLELHGPYYAFIVHGDDELGALVDLHRKLSEAGINVENSTGLADGRGGYRYILHVRQEDFQRAADLLGASHQASPWDHVTLRVPRHFEATM